MKKVFLFGTIICLLLLTAVLSGCGTLLKKDVAGQAIAGANVSQVVTGSINVLSCVKSGKIVNATVNTSAGIVPRRYSDQCHPYENSFLRNYCNGTTKMIGIKTFCPSNAKCLSSNFSVYCTPK